MAMRHLGISFAIVGLLLLSAGCNPRSSTESSRKIFHLGNASEPQDLDPHAVTGVSEHNLITALFEGLVTLSASGDRPVPGVAEHWEISPDQLVYTFHLREDARWSNGDPVTAQDFVRSFQRILTPSLGAEYAYKLHHLVNAEAFHKGELTDFSQVGARALDEHTLQLTLRHRTPFLLDSMLHYAWFPVHIPTVEKFGGLERKGTAWTAAGNLVGNGPFVLQSWQRHQKIVATRSPVYWNRDRIKLDEVHFHAIDDLDAEERMFRAGQLHKTYTLPLSKLEVYRRQYSDSYREDPYYGVYYYALNTTRPPLDDPRVRRALALAIDREALVQNVLRGGQKPAWNFTPPSDKFTSQARLQGDVNEARRLLAEAGFPGGRGFPRLELLYNTQSSHRILAEAIQQMWRTQLGVEVSLHNQEWGVFLSSVHGKNFQIARQGWIGDYPDPHTFLDLWATGGGNNVTGWSHPEYDRLLRSALQTRTEGERMAVYQQLETLIVEEMPVIPLYFYTNVYAISPAVQGFPTHPLGQFSWQFLDLLRP